MMKRTGKSRKKHKTPARKIGSLRRQIAKLEKCEIRHRSTEEKLKKAYKMYRDTIEKAPFGAYIINKKGKVEYVNPAMLRIAGDSRKVFMSLNMLTLPPYRKLKLTDRIKAAFKGEYFRIGPVKYTSYIGKKTTIRNFTGVPLEENGGKKVLVFVEDITGLKKSEEELRKAYNAIETSFNAVFTSNFKGEVVYANLAAARMWGFKDPHEMIGTHVLDYWAKSSRKKAKEIISILTMENSYSGGELIGRRKDGTEFIAEFNSVLVRDESGKPVGMTGSFCDITERKKAEMALKESEQKFRDLTETTSDWIWEVDSSGVYTYTSPKVKDVLGYEADEVLGKSIFDFMFGREAKKVSRFFKEKVDKKESFYGLENINRHKNGHPVILETSGIPLFDERGKLRGYRGIDRDITERKKEEDILKESEQRFRVICDNASIGMYVVSLDTRKTYMVNKKFCQMTGYSEEEFKGLRVENIHAKEDLPYVLSQFKKLASGEVMMSRDMPVKRKDGSIFYADINATPIMLGGKVYLLGFFNDVTERKKMEQLKDEFINTVSHELRTPLAIIRESVFIAVKKIGKDISDDQRKFFDITKKNIERLNRLINDVLDYQKLFAGKMRFDRKRGDINALVKEIRKEMSPLAEEKGIRINVRLAGDLPDVRFDRYRIAQVLMNLVNNAVKFTDKGRITLITARNADGIRVSVKDTGIGIKENEIDKLFQSFTQLTGATEGGQTRGTGLGLAISKKIIEQHGGSIRVKSKYGRGSVFSFFLPTA